MEGEDGRGKWNHLWELRWIEAGNVGLLFKIPFGPSADGRSSWERVVAFFRLSPLSRGILRVWDQKSRKE